MKDTGHTAEQIPISLTIDGQSVAALSGATVLEAATNIGINIPHLCHLPGATGICEFYCHGRVWSGPATDQGKKSLARHRLPGLPPSPRQAQGPCGNALQYNPCHGHERADC